MFAVPSALLGLTSLFGMGRGGSPTLSIALICVRLMTLDVQRLRSNISDVKNNNPIAVINESQARSLDVSLSSRTRKMKSAHEKALGQLVLLD